MTVAPKAISFTSSQSPLFLTDGGLETTLVFHHNIELRDFAAFELLDNESGRALLRNYYRDYASMALAHGLGFVFESPSWRSNPDWGKRLGYSAADLDAINQDAIALMKEVRDSYSDKSLTAAISGCVGPRGDGYLADARMSAADAQQYHLPQIRSFSKAGADLVTAVTMTYIDEAIGIVRAAEDQGLPAIVSFTVETDGRLPSGQTLQEAIAQVDEATGSAPIHYMVNCAHPSHFESHLPEEPWVSRIGGIRANASRCSHAELDAAPQLDEGNPEAFGSEHRELIARLPNLRVLGGCCGTDARHVASLCNYRLTTLRQTA